MKLFSPWLHPYDHIGPVTTNESRFRKALVTREARWDRTEVVHERYQKNWQKSVNYLCNTAVLCNDLQEIAPAVTENPVHPFAHFDLRRIEHVTDKGKSSAFGS
jgi:hypothetical protein